MAASYPTAYDILPDPAANLSGPPLHSSIHNAQNEAIEAIEHELGLDPSGAAATLVARLATLDALVAANAVLAVPPVWSNWDPIIDQDGSATVTYTKNNARYVKHGRTVTAQFTVTMTAASGGVGNIGVSLPVPAAAPAATVRQVVGVIQVTDASVAGGTILTGALVLWHSLRAAGSVSGSNDYIGSGFTINVGDVVNVTMTYESAA